MRRAMRAIPGFFILAALTAIGEPNNSVADREPDSPKFATLLGVAVKPESKGS